MNPPQQRVCFQGLASCVAPAYFELTCVQVGGRVSKEFSVTTCNLTRNYTIGSSVDFSFGYAKYLPIITPSRVEGGSNTFIHLRKGAKLEYYASRAGKWGYYQRSEKEFWGGRLTFWGTSCSVIDWDGNGNGTQLTNEGQPAGLFGSDGRKSFFLGGSSDKKAMTIENDGTLRLGINADTATPFGCTSSGTARFTVTTCEDANGASYTCS